MPLDENPRLIDTPMPIRTPRLLIRPKQAGDGALTAAAVAETWDDLHQWMAWAESLSDFTPDQQEIHVRHQVAMFQKRDEINLLGIETATGQPVVWCALNDIDWKTRQCNTGFWVRKGAHNRGFGTESTNALLRYGFAVLGLRRIVITHSAENAASRRIIEKLGFGWEGIHRAANRLPGGRVADRWCYSRVDVVGLPPLAVKWGES